MTSKEFVLLEIPNARSERHTTRREEAYWLIREKGKSMYIAEGKTESNAWVNAKKNLKI